LQYIRCIIHDICDIYIYTHTHVYMCIYMTYHTHAVILQAHEDKILHVHMYEHSHRCAEGGAGLIYEQKMPIAGDTIW